MGTAIQKAIALIFSSDPELLNILSTTAQLCLTSSVLALLIGLPVGIALGAGRFPGRSVLVVLNRTLMGMPPVVCGLLFYMLCSGVGPFRHLKLLFTVKLRFGWGKRFLLLVNECVYSIFSVYLLAFARAIAEVGAVSMVGGAIAWKTNVMTTAIMQYTNRGNFTLGIALGLILMLLSLAVNIAVSLMQRRLSR